MYQIQLYDKKNIGDLVWPDTCDGHYAKNYLLPMIENGVDKYIKNVCTELMVLLINDIVIPLTINDSQFANSYVCSLYTHYITYPQEEIKLVNIPILERILIPLVQAFGGILKYTNINKVVSVNNWMLSTNLYPNIPNKYVDEITQFLGQRFSKHAILWRSINRKLYPELSSALNNNGYKLIASRQIYLIDTTLETLDIVKKERNIIKKDLKLFDTTDYLTTEQIDFSQTTYLRIVELYNKLYLNKYSYCNPQYTADFIQLAAEKGILKIILLTKLNRPDAVLGYFVRSNIMTTPLFGYDTDLPLDTGLYRMLSSLVLLSAQKSKYYLNQSSGAPAFKRCRGARPQIEYNAVLYTHLPYSQRICFSLIIRIA